jgi:hypothetical protein
VLLSSGCGLFSAQAEAPAASSAPMSSTTSPTPSATPTTAPAGATAALVDSVDGRPARLSVTAGSVVRGLAPVLAAAGSGGACGLTDDTAEYAEVSVVFTVPDEARKDRPVTANLRMDLSVPDGAGVFLETDDPSTECAGGAGLPAQATLQTLYLAAEHQTITVYVVSRRGGLPGATLRLQNLRYHPGSTGGSERTWTVGQVTGLTTCEGDPNSLCVPLA